MNNVPEEISHISDAKQSTPEEIEIIPFFTYAYGSNIRLQGRVQTSPKSSLNRNVPSNNWEGGVLAELYPDGKQEAQVEIRVGENLFRGLTDGGGYYYIEEECPVPLPYGLNSASATVTKLQEKEIKPVTRMHNIILPNTQASTCGVICAIDDAILQSPDSDPMKTIYNALFQNSKQRARVPGTLEFLHLLVQGSGNELNTIFYVSNCPWNAYKSLLGFIQQNQYPSGPILLRDLMIGELMQSTHKIATISKVLKDFPSLPFVLLGDTSDKDIHIYLEIVRAHPNRIKLVLIRDIGDSKKLEATRAAINAENSLAVPIYIVPDFTQSPRVCAQYGLIHLPFLPQEIVEPSGPEYTTVRS